MRAGTQLRQPDRHGRRSPVLLLHTNLKLGARYYNPTTGRFTQPDPSGKEANTYNYTSCNPVNSTDPTGLLSLCTSLAIQGVVYGLGSLVTGVLAFGATGSILGAPAGAVLGYASVSLAAGGLLVGSQALHDVRSTPARCYTRSRRCGSC